VGFIRVNYNNLLKYFIFYFLLLFTVNLGTYIILKIKNQSLSFGIINPVLLVILTILLYVMLDKFQFIENKKLYKKMNILLFIIFLLLLWIELIIFNEFLFYFIIFNLILIFILFFILIIYKQNSENSKHY
jgi:phosphatidylserine synthase